MDSQSAIDMCREAIWVTLLVSSPVLAAGLVVGLAIGLLQALTQVQEQTVSFVPKLVAMIVVLSLSLPWLLAQMMQYVRDMYQNIPSSL